MTSQEKVVEEEEQSQKARTKEEFEAAWNSHINSLGVLGFSLKNQEQVQKLLSIVEELKSLVIAASIDTYGE